MATHVYKMVVSYDARFAIRKLHFVIAVKAARSIEEEVRALYRYVHNTQGKLETWQQINEEDAPCAPHVTLNLYQISEC